MTDLHETSSRRPSRGRRILGNLGWVLGGVALALLLVANPLGIHPLDSWMHQLLGHRHPDGAPTEAATEGEAKQLWTCGMHPQVISEEPGQCPICGMDLVPLEMDEPAGGPADHDHPAAASAAAGEQADMADSGPTVRIDPAAIQNMNVETEVVERRDLAKPIRTVGYLDYDQQAMVTVTTKYAGFVEKVYVNYLGEPVRKGQPLFEIYAPELVQTQEELLSALSFARRLADAPAESRRRAEALAEAARTRLSFWDISKAQVQRLEESGKVLRTLTVSAPASGLVMKRMPGLEGMAVQPGMELFHIADLSSLWLSAEVYEDQLPWLSPGSEAEITLSYFPGETFRGKVRFVAPEVQEKTRTVGLRVEVPNPDGRLRAGMYAEVRFAPLSAKDAVAVPRQSVIRSGQRNVVIVALGDGRFAPRGVTLGAEGDDYVQVLHGVEAGETIVTSSQFLIDSESNLREAIQMLLDRRKSGGGTGDGAGMGGDGMGGAASSGHGDPG